MVRLWRRERGSQADGSTAPPAVDEACPPEETPSSELETTAVDELASLLKIWGQHTFDLDEIKAPAISEQLERWRRHILSAAPMDQDQASATSGSATAKRRDWPGLRAFAARIRRGEQAYVGRQVVGTREVMGNFLQTLGQVLAEDQEEQTRVLAIIGELRNTIQHSPSIDTLSREAMRAIDLISAITKERAQRHKGVLQDLTEKLQELRGELENAQREMELDPLTRLYNRKAFDVQVERVFELCKLSGQPACLMMVDADHFKRVNDTHGHQTGDLVLRRIADCCAQSFPRRTDFVARYGGEEFAVVLQDTPLDTGRQLGERLVETIRALRIPHESGELSITVSIGLAGLMAHSSATQWLGAADAALYAAKNAGRDRLHSGRP